MVDSRQYHESWNPFYPDLSLPYQDDASDPKGYWDQVVRNALTLRTQGNEFACLHSAVDRHAPDADIVLIIEMYDMHTGDYGYAALFRHDDRIVFRASPLRAYGTRASKYEGPPMEKLDVLWSLLEDRQWVSQLESRDYVRRYLADGRWFIENPTFVHLYHRHTGKRVTWVLDHAGVNPWGSLPRYHDERRLEDVPKALPVNELIQKDREAIYSNGWINTAWLEADSPGYWATRPNDELKAIADAFRASYDARVILNAMILIGDNEFDGVGRQ